MNESLALPDDYAKEAAIERLVEQLFIRMQILDPTDTPEWNALDDMDRGPIVIVSNGSFVLQETFKSL